MHHKFTIKTKSLVWRDRNIVFLFFKLQMLVMVTLLAYIVVLV